VTGDADGAKAGEVKERAAGKEPAARESVSPVALPLSVELETSLQHSLGWTIAGLLIGGLLIWKLGTVGKWGGVALIVAGVYHGWNVFQILSHPPGTIVVTETEVSLPRGLNVPRPVRVKREEVTAVYFLRRSVPWNHVSPVLVVELGATAMAFPCNWFASEADQRRVVHALLGGAPGAAKAKAKPDDAGAAAAG
jgi:hypothetical protein